jgi:hypothetical protein
LPPTHTQLSEEIAEILWSGTSAYHTEAVGDRLGMPPADSGFEPMRSKRAHVRNRLARVPLDELREIARRVIEEFPEDSADLDQLLSGSGFRGPDGEMRNIIFAADGPKPRIVLKDAISNTIEIVEGAHNCLVYDRPIGPGGLTWGGLLDWWQGRTGEGDRRAAAEGLYRRLKRSLASPPEELVFETYCARYAAGKEDLPALIPQVYLHYNPYTRRELESLAPGADIKRQRMDFLMLPTRRLRVVVEIDGKQHYADGDRASPQLYAKMAREDRGIRLAGYEVFRFGASELSEDAGRAAASEFFDLLLDRVRI